MVHGLSVHVHARVAGRRDHDKDNDLPAPAGIDYVALIEAAPAGRSVDLDRPDQEQQP